MDATVFEAKSKLTRAYRRDNNRLRLKNNRVAPTGVKKKYARHALFSRFQGRLAVRDGGGSLLCQPAFVRDYNAPLTV